ncbi:MAG: imelysin family protein [Pseudomonadota bacterium]
MRLALVLTLFAVPAFAGVDEVLSEHILPRHAKLTEATATLARMAEEDCQIGTVRPAFHDAYDAWIEVSHIQFGPIEDQGLSLAMSFWPDPKDSTGKAIGRLIAAEDPIVDDANAFPEVSAAAQGFTALERLIFDDTQNEAYRCRMIRAVTSDLARKSTTINAAWPEYAGLLTSPNDRYQSETEAQRAIYTALATGLEFLHDQRLGRPLGTFDRPRPRRAEARRSERSLRHIRLSLVALNDLASKLSDADLPKATAAFENAILRATSIDDPALAGVADPAQRFKIEVLQQSIRAIQVAVIEEIGKPLGISAGFNALDGD